MKSYFHKLIAFIRSGISDEVVLLGHRKSPEKAVKHLRALIKDAADWTVTHHVVVDACGTQLVGLATWGPTVTLRTLGYEHRFRIFNVDRFGSRYIYAVPAEKVGADFHLPDIDLSTSERMALVALADTFPQKESSKVILLQDKCPAKGAVLTASAASAIDAERLLALLADHHGLLDILVAFIDSQLRAVKRCREAPCGCYIFAENNSADYSSLFNALTISNSPGSFGSGPVDIYLRKDREINNKAIADWATYAGRVLVLHPGAYSQARTIAEFIEATELHKRCGGSNDVGLPVVPIVQMGQTVSSAYVHNIIAHDNGANLTQADLLVLRNAVKTIIRHDMAAAIYTEWKEQRCSDSGALTNWFDLWRDSIAQIAIRRWFYRRKDLCTNALSLLRQTQRDQSAEIEHRAAAIHAVVAALKNPDTFADRVEDRPPTQVGATYAPDNKHIAFYFEPMAGNDAGRTFLAFSADRLKRFAAEFGCEPTQYGDLLDALDRAGLLDNSNRSIKVCGKTTDFVTIRT